MTEGAHTCVDCGADIHPALEHGVGSRCDECSVLYWRSLTPTSKPQLADLVEWAPRQMTDAEAALAARILDAPPAPPEEPAPEPREVQCKGCGEWFNNGEVACHLSCGVASVPAPEPTPPGWRRTEAMGGGFVKVPERVEPCRVAGDGQHDPGLTPGAGVTCTKCGDALPMGYPMPAEPVGRDVPPPDLFNMLVEAIGCLGTSDEGMSSEYALRDRFDALLGGKYSTDEERVALLSAMVTHGPDRAAIEEHERKVREAIAAALRDNLDMGVADVLREIEAGTFGRVT